MTLKGELMNKILFQDYQFHELPRMPLTSIIQQNIPRTKTFVEIIKGTAWTTLIE